MRKLIVSLYTGYVGSETREALLVDEDATDEEISEITYDMAIQNAERYGIYPYPEYEDDMEESVEYSEGIDSSFEDYVPENHDMYRPGGGSFERDFV